jgi:hypothetical protein
MIEVDEDSKEHSDHCFVSIKVKLPDEQHHHEKMGDR